MWRFLRRLLTSEYLVLLLTALYVLCLWPFAPEIVSAQTALEVIMAMLPLLLLAIGQTFVLIVAGIDLSITSTMAFSSVVAAALMTGDGGYLAGNALAVPVALIAFLLIGLAVGCANGLCVVRLGMPSFMVTLVAQTFLSGAAIWFTSLHSTSVSIGDLPAAFSVIGRGGIAGIPYALLLCLVVAFAAHWLLGRTTLGRWLYAVGNNPRAATVSGVPTGRVIIIAFVLSGFCAALASIVYTSRLETGTPVLGQRVLLDVIGAAVIGGVSLFGGRGKISWVILGVLFLSVVDKGLQLLGLSQSIVFAVKGGVILLAAIIDALRSRILVRVAA
ncbi:ribose/xylose/arabinose/galactoside ABC-type transport system permease subunit [Kaistia hirudinis]|uniref:Autoinducer 2 import system permease protein LsrD n=1 Tax=Kaistia hirudinis TaxID=1293440 RepID=A0A840ARG8_9HYPH|nr:ABC transporter permease [Kaistia hirudinis]MBB3931848.1 ribose/xylose/arabinose/galactoside ABC-type transport system permease subunit [Kaistia hirudinis]